MNKEMKTRMLRNTMVGVILLVCLHYLLGALEINNEWFIPIFDVQTSFTVLSLGMILIFWWDGSIYLREHQPGELQGTYTGMALVLAFGVFVSVAIHEFSHGIVSTMLGYRIEEAGFTLWGAYVSPETSIFDMKPWEQVFVAFAGPVSNLLIGSIAALYVAFFGESLLENSVQYIAYSNLILAMYNMIPFVLLLDGGKVLHGLLRMFGLSLGFTNIMQIILGAVIYVAFKVITYDKPTLKERLSTL